MPTLTDAGAKPYAPPKLRQMVTEAAFRRRRVLLATVAVVVGLVALATVLMHRKYQAQAVLMVQNVRPAAPLTTSPTDRPLQNTEVSTTEVNSEVELLESQVVARRALGAPVGGLETEAQARAVRKLEGQLKVEAVHQTALIQVSFVANSPEQARESLERLLDAYFEERAHTTQSSGAASFFDQQAADKGRQVEQDQAELTAFQVSHGIADLDDQKKLQVQRIAGLEDQLHTVEASLAAGQSRLAAQKHMLALTPARTPTVERTITNQYSQERLGTALVDLENRRTELLKRYPPTDRQVTEVNEKIATTQRAIAQASTQPAGETATDVNPVWQSLENSVAAARGDLSGLAAQRDELQRQRKAAEARLSELEQATATYDALRRKLTQSQADYTAYAAKRDEAQISQALDRAKMFDVSLVQPPLASPDPVRPKPVLYLAAGTAFALVLGMLLALYADTSAEQVYTPAQLDAVTGMRTAAVVTDEVAEPGLAESNRVEYRRLLLAIRSALEGVGEGKCVAFTSARAGEGVSFVAQHVAAEAARQTGTRAVLLDMQALLTQFEVEGDASFSLRETPDGYSVLALREDEAGATAVAVPGTTDPAAGLHGQFSNRMQPLLEQVRQEFDYVLLDCPSLQRSTLAPELDLAVDGYVVVVGAGAARKQNLEGMAATLGGTRAPLLGYVLNRRRYPVPAWLHRVLW